MFSVSDITSTLYLVLKWHAVKKPLSPEKSNSAGDKVYIHCKQALMNQGLIAEYAFHFHENCELAIQLSLNYMENFDFVQ